MPKIESIRPGGSLSATFAEYPLPDLLLGILRGNLSGRLDITLHPEPRNRIYFRDGVPIAVDLADARVSMMHMLIETGQVSEAAGLELLRIAEGMDVSESVILEEREVLPPGRARELEARRARAQLVRLFDVGTVDFTFHEGIDCPEQVRLTILQPLPIVYEGLCATQDRALLERILEDYTGRSFVLAPTFPRGVDPFEWGPDVDRALGRLEEEPHTLADLLELGLDPRTASAALATLVLAGMLEVRDKAAPAKPKSDPRTRSAGAAPANPQRMPLDESAADETSGLVIHYKSGAKAKPGKDTPPAPAPAPALLEYESVKARFANYDGKNYYQILRVAPNTDSRTGRTRLSVPGATARRRRQ